MPADVRDYTTVTAQPQKILTSGTLGAFQTASGGLALDSIAHAVVLVVDNDITAVSLSGFTSGLQYVNVATLVSGPKVYGAAIFPGVDTSIVYSLTSSGNPVNWWVLEIVDVLVPLLLGQLAEYGQNAAQTSFGGVQVVASSLQVLPTAVPSDVVKSVVVNAVIAGNATLALVAAVAGQTVYPLELNLMAITAGATTVQLQDTAPTGLANVATNLTGFQPHRLEAVSAGGGLAVQLKNLFGVAAGQLVGELIYVQK